MSTDGVFRYPHGPHERRHGPRGYADYRSFKPWLRDEFSFRCVYCLWREAWSADGDGSFSVDHVRPSVSQPDLRGDYDNMVYACCRCNVIKQDSSLPLDPGVDGLGRVLEIASDGTVRGITDDGQRMVEICRLNRPTLIQARRRLLRVLDQLKSNGTEAAIALWREFLAYPANLPVLRQLHPPGGNTRPVGIAASSFERRKRGELPDTY